MSKTQKDIYISMLVAQGLVLGLIENMIPSPFSFAPGTKLGLANLITIIAIFTMRKRESFLLVCMRLALTTFLGGTIMTLAFSVCGAFLSYLGMLTLKQLGPKRVSIIGISAAGGFLHNVGQLLAMCFFSQSWLMMSYLPFLSFFGILSGTAIGITANYLLRHVRTMQQFQLNYDRTSNQNWSQYFQ